MAKKRAKSEEPKKTVKSEEPKKKKPISLNILEIAKRIQKLEQTAGMPSEYPATKVMLSDGMTSVEDRLDANTFGTAVDISAYTSSNPYVAPSDGYTTIALSGAGSMGDIYVEGVNVMRTNAYSGNNYPVASVFVKKGMHVYINILSGAGSGAFYPLS